MQAAVTRLQRPRSRINVPVLGGAEKAAWGSLDYPSLGVPLHWHLMPKRTPECVRGGRNRSMSKKECSVVGEQIGDRQLPKGRTEM